MTIRSLLDPRFTCGKHGLLDGVIMMCYDVIMIRTQIQLPEEQYEALKRQAADSEKSIAQQIREAISVYLERNRAPKRRVEEIAGKYQPQDLRDLKDHDRGIAEAIESSKQRESKR